MAVDFGEPVTQIFKALGQEATFVPETGDTKTIIVLPSQPDAILGIEGGKIQASTLTLEVLREEVAAFKRGKDKIIFKGDTYVVQHARIKDALKLVWQVDTYQVGC